MKDKIADVLDVETSADTALVVSKHLTIDNNTVSIVVEMLHSNTLLIKGLSDYLIYQILSMLVNNASIEEPLLKQVDNNVDLIIPKEVVMSDLHLEAETEYTDAIAETEEIIETEYDDEIEVSDRVLELFSQIEEMDLSLSEILSLIERLTVLAQEKHQEEQKELEDDDEIEDEEYDDEDQE